MCKEENREREIPFTGLLPKSPKPPRMDQAEAMSQ